MTQSEPAAASSLGQTLSQMFVSRDDHDDDRGGEREDRCPVSRSSKCILDHGFVARGQRASPDLESEKYTAEQLSALRLCNYLLHTGNREVIIGLKVVLRSLLALVDQPAEASADQRCGSTSDQQRPGGRRGSGCLGGEQVPRRE